MKKKIMFAWIVVCLTAFVLFACQENKGKPVPDAPGGSIVTPGDDDKDKPDEPVVRGDSEYAGEREIYLTAGTGAVTLGLKLNGNDISEISVNGTKSEAVPNISDASVSLDLSSELKYGENKVRITDSAQKKFGFIVYSGVAKEDILYFDFEIRSYANNADVAVPSTVVQDGIDGASLQLTKNSDGGNLFGFFPNGEYGFPAFTFKANTEYMLSFDYKVLDGTSADWWCPIRFGDNGDVIYIRDDYTWSNPGVNILYTQTTLQENKDGSRRATAIFKTTDLCKALDVPNWGGAVNILLDNMCLKTLNPSVKRIACVGDSITEAADSDFSYPEKLQTILGYDEYFVFNFGKSAANVLEEGVYPYRTWAKWQYDYLKTWNPDVIVMMLGTNDGRYGSGIETYKDTAFIDAYMSLVHEFEDMCDRFYINTSPYAFGNEYGIKAADVNERIVNIQGWIAYENDIPLIDVHAAVKACDRASYFPDYIHGNDAGYAVIAEAVAAGLKGAQAVTKYHLAYALQTCRDKASRVYTDAYAVYTDTDATKQEIDRSADSLKSLMVIPDSVQTTVLSQNVYTGSDSKTVVLPIKVRGESVASIALGETTLSASDFTVESTGIKIASSVTEAFAAGAYLAEVTLSETGKVSLVVYIGYDEGEALLIDSVVNTYVNTDNALLANEIGTRFDGACIHIYHDKLGTVIGIDANASFGFIRFEFKANQTYTISFDYIIGENMSGASWFSVGNDKACDWDVGNHTVVGLNGVTASITDEGEYHHFEMTFTAPDTQGLIQVQLPGWFNQTDLYMDNLFICQTTP